MNDFERYLPQPNADALQQPRSDVQSGASSTDQMTTGAVQQSTFNATQDQLNTNALRVGESTVTVPNTTSTSSHSSGQADAAGVFWWLIVLPLLLIVMWLIGKSRPQAEPDDTWDVPVEEPSELIDEADEPEAVIGPEKPAPTTRPVAKKPRTTKKKHKSKKR